MFGRNGGWYAFTTFHSFVPPPFRFTKKRDRLRNTFTQVYFILSYKYFLYVIILIKLHIIIFPTHNKCHHSKTNVFEWWHKIYSVRSASTGSFFAAILEGIRPAIRVSETLIITRIIAATGGRDAAAGM